jgi:WXXGXW repeat (2 copies)
MRNRILLLASVIILGAVALPANAAVSVNFDIRLAPPVPRVEVVPPARVGFVWAPGYWQWEGRRHVWVTGHWIQARPGYRWVAESWVHHDDRYRFEPGRWERTPEHRGTHDNRRDNRNYNDHNDRGHGRRG